MKLIVLLALGLVGTFLFGSERPQIKPPAKLSARFLEYQDKVQEFQLELVTARLNLANAKVELAQVREECLRTKRLVNRGYETTNNLTGCEANVTANETLVAQLETALKTSERNRDIWTIRLAGETGETDLNSLAEKYANKWKVALELIKAQIANSQLRQVRAEEYFEYAKRVLKKGYINGFDYDRALNVVITTRNEVEAFQVRQKEIEASLHETEADLLLLQKPVTP